MSKIRGSKSVACFETGHVGGRVSKRFHRWIGIGGLTAGVGPLGEMHSEEGKESDLAGHN